MEAIVKKLKNCLDLSVYSIQYPFNFPIFKYNEH